MKSTTCLFLVLIVTSAIVIADDGPMLPIDLNAKWNDLAEVPRNARPRNWGVNSKFSEGELKLVLFEEGCVLELQAHDHAEHPFHVFNRDADIKTEPGAIVEVKVLARGKGELGVVGYLYDGSGDSVGIAVSEQGPSSTLSEEFTELAYQLVVPGASRGKAAATHLKIALVLSPGANVLIKSVEAATNHDQ